MLRRITPLFLLASLAWARPKFEIHGTVADAHFHQLLSDVEITLIRSGAPTGSEPVLLKTDAQGAYRYTPTEPGLWVASARKQGYTRAVSVSELSGVRLSGEHPVGSVDFLLEREGAIFGQVVDEETSEGAAGLALNLYTFSGKNGIAILTISAQVKTDAEGRFSVRARPGGYVIEVAPQEAHMETQFTSEDIDSVDSGYRTAFFPGGHGADSAIPAPLASGGSVNLGTIRIRKQPLYRVHVKLGALPCTPRDRLNVTRRAMPAGAPLGLERAMGNLPQSIPCVTSLLLTQQMPGDYSLVLSPRPPVQAMAQVRYTIAEENVGLEMRWRQETTLRGTIVAAERTVELPFESLQVTLRPPADEPTAVSYGSLDVDSKGRFELTGMLLGRQTVRVEGLGPEYFVKEMRYGGVRLPSPLFDFTGEAQLDIVIGRGPASLSGVVVERDKPKPNADVVLLPWPIPEFDPNGAIHHIRADVDGRFSIAGVAPGDYRIFAVAEKDREESQEPAPWRRLTERAQPVELASGEVLTLRLSVADPSQ